MLRRAEPVLYAFDLLMRDGRDLRQLGLLARKKELRRVLPRRCDRLMYVDHVLGRGIDLFQAVCDMDLEGIVANRRPASRARASRSAARTALLLRNGRIPDRADVLRAHRAECPTIDEYPNGAMFSVLPVPSG